MLNVLWAAFFALAFVCGAANGRLGEVSAALTEGAAGAVTLAISIAGLMCFWSGIMEVMQQSGLTAVIARRLLPVLRPLFGKKAAEDSEAMQAVSANVTANLLGLSNAATPLGLRAASRLHKISGQRRGVGRGADADGAEFRLHTDRAVHSRCGSRGLRSEGAV